MRNLKGVLRNNFKIYYPERDFELKNRESIFERRVSGKGVL